MVLLSLAIMVNPPLTSKALISNKEFKTLCLSLIGPISVSVTLVSAFLSTLVPLPL